MSSTSPHEKKGGHFFNGFFWGAALGGGVAYLLSTKRGRDILKELFADGLDMLENATTPDDVEEFAPAGEDLVEEEVQMTPKEVEAQTALEPEVEPVRKTEPASKKRFFKARKK